MTAPALDSRTWLAWGLGAMMPVLLGRNPWLLLEVLLILLIVRSTWLPPADERRLDWFLRIAGVTVVISIVFNVFTVHSGDVVIGSLPGGWQVIGGDITLNALVYGLLSGIAIFSLVLTGVTVTALVSWLDLFHHLPPRLATVAVTGSVAWSFLPRLAESWGTIREAQAMRGNRLRGPRDVLPLVIPLLASSLDRALVTAEVLEARGFGGIGVSRNPSSSRRTVGAALLALGSLLAAVGAFCLAVGQPVFGVTCLAFAAGSIWLGTRLDPQPGLRRTRLIEGSWSRADMLSVAAATTAVVSVLALMAVNPEALTYATYPELSLPAVPVWTMLGVSLLLVPAFTGSRPEAA